MNTMFRVQGSRFRVCYRQGGLVHAEHGTRNTERAALGVLLAAAMLLVPMAALSQAMTDPTRPPGAYATGDPDAGGEAGGGPVLQSVMISPTRKAAIISGEMVKLGEKFGDAVLVKVAENEVVLKTGDATQVLKMYPGVEKREAAPAEVKRAPRGSKTPRGGGEPAASGASPR